MQVADDEALTKNGVIDSMGIFRLVSFLEDTFNVRIGDEEITHDNLESIDAIEKLVIAKSKK
jgi:acyl carrier protein